MPEDVELNTTLGTIVAVDLDTDTNGEVFFEIVSGDTDRFSIVAMQTGSTFSAALINEQVDYTHVTDFSSYLLASTTFHIAVV